MKAFIFATLLCILPTAFATDGEKEAKTQTPLIFGKLLEKIYRPDIYIPRMIEKEVLKRKFDKYEYRLSKMPSIDTSSVFDFQEYLNTGLTPDRSCDEVCPKDFRIFAMNKDQLKRSPETHLGVLNTNEYFEKYRKKTIGYCWGWSSVLADFQHLAFFDPDNKLNQELPADIISYYKNLIKRVAVKNKTVIFPGVSSIRELTSIPEISDYLLTVIGQRWALNATHIQAIGNMLVDDVKMAPEEYRHIVSQLRYLKSIGVMPKIIFADDSPGFMGNWSHVVNVTDVKSFKDGSHKIYINESNYFPEDDEEESYHIYISPEGTAHYKPLLKSNRIINTGTPYDRVGRIKFGHEFERDIAKYVSSLNKMCKKITKCKNK